MPIELLLAIAIAAIVLLLPVLVPVWIVRRAERHAPETVAASRLGLFGTGLIALVVVCWFAGISTSAELANLLLLVAAVVAGLALSVMAFFCRPAWLGVVVGLFGGAAWVLMLLLVGFDSSMNGPGHVLTLDDGKYCRASQYGGVLGDSGTKIELFRRYAFVEYSTGKHAYSEIDPEPYDTQYADKAQFQRCFQLHGKTPAW